MSKVSESKPFQILTKLQTRVGGNLRISSRGVPHLVINGEGGISACYFGKHKTIRVFTNYMCCGPQEKFDFTEWKPLIASIEKYKGTIND